MEDKKNPSQIPWRNPTEESEVRSAQTVQQQQGHRNAPNSNTWSKETSASPAPPLQESNPPPSSSAQTQTSGNTVPDSPGAYSVQLGERAELQNPGFVSPQEHEEMQASTTGEETQGTTTTEIPLASEVVGSQDDLRDQVRRILEDEAVQAEGVVAQDHLERGNQQNTPEPPEPFCNRRRAAIIALIIVIVAVALGVAIPLATKGNNVSSAAPNSQDTGDTGNEGVEVDDPVVTSPTLSPTPFPTKTPAELCEQDADCPLGECAFESYTGAAKLACCPTGTSSFISSFDHNVYPKASSANFCQGQPNGASCPINALCESNICVFGTCEGELREVSATCEENFDCASSVCAFGVCQEGPFEAGEECQEDADCNLGECAFANYTAAAKAVCCPTGTSSFISSFDHNVYPKASSANFCRGQPNGATCPINALCESNICVFGKCEGALIATSAPCEENADCESSVCANGVCQAGAFAAGEECQEDADCSLGECAFGNYTAAAKAVCCPTGTSSFISSFDHNVYPKASSANFCRGQPNGAACPINALCESGICVFGICEAELRATSASCEENADCTSSVCAFGVCQAGAFAAGEECQEDADCSLGECAFADYTAGAKAICCPTGTSSFISSFSHDVYPKASSANFCRDQPTGSACPIDALCESGVCTNGVCD